MSIPNIQSKRLTRVSRFDFLLDGIENDEDAGPIQLEFQDQTILQLELVPDGESVDFCWKDLETAKAEDEISDWSKINLSNKEPFARLPGNKVTGVDDLLFGSIKDTEEKMVIAGYGIQFENSHSLVYYNAGDYAKIYVDEMPPAFPKTFKLIWKNGVFEDLVG